MPPLYILRHGETIWNREGRLQGALDSALTTTGRVQAARQGAILRAAMVPASARCSPQGRARMTAALAGLAPEIDDRLAEITLGDWEGELIETVAPPPGILWKFDAPNGETLTAAQGRVDAFLRSVRRPTVVVTHGVTGIILRSWCLNLSPQDWDLMEDPQGVVHRIVDGHETLLR